jgi:hypothetical protein
MRISFARIHFKSLSLDLATIKTHHLFDREASIADGRCAHCSVMQSGPRPDGSCASERPPHCMRLTCRACVDFLFAFSSSSTTRLRSFAATRDEYDIRAPITLLPSEEGIIITIASIKSLYFPFSAQQLTRATASSFTNSVAPLTETFAEVAGFLRNFAYTVFVPCYP